MSSLDDSMMFPNAGKHYPDEHVDELVLEFHNNPLYADPSNLTRLAHRLGRTTGAIEMFFRWCAEADFPERANNRIRRQIAASRLRLGLT